MVAVLSGDIVNSSKMKKMTTVELMYRLERFLDEQRVHYPEMRFEMYRGDAFQIVLYQPELSVRLAVLIRTFVIAQSPDANERCDVRISIGVGPVDNMDERVTLSSGKAFVYSGHALDRMKIKERLVFMTGNTMLNSDMFVATAALSIIISQWTLKRANAALMMMLGESRDEICKKLKIIETTLSTALSGSNYSELQKILKWVEEKIKRYNRQLTI